MKGMANVSIKAFPKIILSGDERRFKAPGERHVLEVFCSKE
jgi:hypothetical protein